VNGATWPLPAIQAIQSPSPALLLLTDDGGELPIHPLWIRERCADAACMDAQTQQRLYNPSDLPPDLGITAAAETAPGVFSVSFTDDHTSIFTQAALLAHAGADTLPARRPWTASNHAPDTHMWPDQDDKAAIFDILTAYLRDGYVILRNVPTTHGAVLAVGRAFGFPRETNFGVLFDVRSVPNAEDLAYTSLSLDPHTDNPYRAPVPGIQLLHCLTNRTSGGLSTLVDGLAVAEALRADDAAAFAILTQTKVRFRYIDAVTEHVAYAPLIETDMAGDFAAIHVSPRLDFVPLLSPAKLAEFYRARTKLDHMLRSAAYEIRFRLDDGDLVMFDNVRLLHGRTSFDPEEGLRHLQGCYIDADGPRSLYRVLARGRA